MGSTNHCGGYYFKVPQGASEEGLFAGLGHSWLTPPLLYKSSLWDAPSPCLPPLFRLAFPDPLCTGFKA